jgi:hypothetical protein
MSAPVAKVMADTLVERVTGQHSAPAVPVEVQLVMTDRALLAGDSEPAELNGYGPLPAPLARDSLRGDNDSPSAQRADMWLRRLYTTPDGRSLIAMDTRRRCFDGQSRRCRPRGGVPRVRARHSHGLGHPQDRAPRRGPGQLLRPRALLRQVPSLLHPSDKTKPSQISATFDDGLVEIVVSGAAGRSANTRIELKDRSSAPTTRTLS